ncbi:MAG: hypothetical protein RIC14_03060 [Filomicrobium sp.]
MGDPKQPSLYAIFREDDPTTRTYAWVVSIQRRGKIWRRHFADQSYGGKDKALKAAQKFRDKLAAAHPPMSRAEYADRPRKNNRSGMTGVIRREIISGKEGEQRTRAYWTAFWPGEKPGQRGSLSFAVAKHGEEGAQKMAIRARKRALVQLEGTYVNSRELRKWIEAQGLDDES